MMPNPILSAVYEGQPLQEVVQWSRQFRLTMLSATLKALDLKIGELAKYRRVIAEEHKKRIELKEENLLKHSNYEVNNHVTP
jgi:hypothetical protein